MAAAQYNLNIARGEDFSFTLTIRDSFDEPVIITTTGNKFKAEIREEFKKPLIQAFSFQTKTAVTGQSTIDSALDVGEIRFNLTNEQTITFDVNKKYKWDFFWTDSGSGNLVHKLLYGDVIVSANITNI